MNFLILWMVPLTVLPVPANPQPNASGPEAVAERLGTFLIGLAGVRAPSWALEEHWPCPRRGLVQHRGGSSGRSVRFHDCDLGDGIVVEGQGTLRWSPAVPEVDALCAIASPAVEGYGGVCGKTLWWDGPLTISVAGRTEASPDRLAVRITWQPPVGTGPEGMRLESESLEIYTVGIRLASFALEMEDRIFQVGREDLPHDLFDLSAQGLESIPNASRSLDALTEVDQRRLVLDGVLRGLGSLIVNEAMESPRGDHVHEIEQCGTSAVTYDTTAREVRIDHRWTRCRGTPRHSLGLVWDGNFTVVLRTSDLERGFEISLLGPVAVGGGVPTVEISSLTLSLEGDLSGASGPLRAKGEIVGPESSRAFDYDLMFQDPGQ